MKKYLFGKWILLVFRFCKWRERRRDRKALKLLAEAVFKIKKQGGPQIASIQIPGFFGFYFDEVTTQNWAIALPKKEIPATSEEKKA